MSDQPPRHRRATTSKRVKKDAPAYRIIVEKFGGLANFCEATGFDRSTVHGWLRNGLVPAKWHEPGLSYQRHIIVCAERKEIDLAGADFIETHDG